MTTDAVSTGIDDSCWVTIDLPMLPSQSIRFCHAIEDLLRLNPYLDIRSWQEESGPFGEGKCFHLHALNEMTGIEHDMDLTVAELSENRLCIEYSEGAKKRLEIQATVPEKASSCSSGDALSILTLREHYDMTLPVEVLEKEVDRSIAHWGSSLRKHLQNTYRWRWLPGYLSLQRFWLTMSPRNRRIGRWLIWIGLAEFLFFIFVFIIFILEHNR